jgi:replicative superfamily II helicase
MDLSKLKLDLGSKKRETDPIRIFGGLTQRGQVETLYGPQQEALNVWHQKHRAKSDVLFSMNTGGGKTLVGLLAAQSLVNETRGKVLFVCPTNQLVQQTAAQAEDCGITVATYGSKAWTNRDRYDSADAAVSRTTTPPSVEEARSSTTRSAPSSSMMPM